MESGNIVSFTSNITVVHQWQDSLCVIPFHWGVEAAVHPVGLSEFEIYTLLAITKHGVHSNKILTLRM